MLSVDITNGIAGQQQRPGIRISVGQQKDSTLTVGLYFTPSAWE